MKNKTKQTSGKKTYYIANTDSYGQRNGTYRSVDLSDDEVETNHMGWKTYKGHFLYESQLDVTYAVQD
jgi:hypothetical protein